MDTFGSVAESTAYIVSIMTLLSVNSHEAPIPTVKFDDGYLKEIIEILAEQNISAIDKSSNQTGSNICQMLEKIQQEVPFQLRCREIAKNINELDATINSFNDIKREILSVTNDDVIVKYKEDVKEIVIMYTYFSTIGSIFDEKHGVGNLMNLFATCKHVEIIPLLTHLKTSFNNNLLKRIENQFLDVTTNVTLDEFKLVMADIIKVAQMSIYCHALTDGTNLQETSKSSFISVDLHTIK